MKALQISSHGSVSDLVVSDVPEPSPGPDEVKIKLEAAALNPSDLGSVLGRFAHAALPRIVGRDFAGTVVDGPAELVGTMVWGSGGDLGITRDGSHAEYLILPRSAVARRPKNLSAEQAAAVGVPFVTAWTALELAQLRQEETLIVSGAAGAVGHAAIQLARARGAKPIALVKRREDAKRLREDEVLGTAASESNDLVEVVRARTDGRGCNVALNGIGAQAFSPMCEALADGGRMVVYAAFAGREVSLDLFTLYRRRLQLFGLNTAVIDAVRGAAVFRALTPLFESGALRPIEVSETFPLSEAKAAYERLEQGAPGKLVLTI